MEKKTFLGRRRDSSAQSLGRYQADSEHVGLTRLACAPNISRIANDRPTISLIAVILAAGTFPMAQAQSSIGQPKITVDVVELEGTLLPKAAQEWLVTSLKQREWEENSDWESDVRNMVTSAEKEGWPDRENQGYWGFSVWEEWKPLRREIRAAARSSNGSCQRRPAKKAGEDRVSRRRRAIGGEIYNRDKIYAGFSAMREAYAERGFIEYTMMISRPLPL